MKGEDTRLKYKVGIFISFSKLVEGLGLECHKGLQVKSPTSSHRRSAGFIIEDEKIYLPRPRSKVLIRVGQRLFSQNSR